MTSGGSDILSIVMPAHNEEAFLGEAVKEATAAASRHFEGYELIIVDDGSTDETGAVAERIAEANARIRVLHNEIPKSLGGAFKDGVAVAAGDYLTVFHGKGAIAAEEIERVWALKGQADIIVPYDVNLYQRPLCRRVLSKTFTRLVNTLFGLRVRYYNHFVLFRRKDLQAIRLRTDSYAFQAEAIVKLLKAGRSYREIDVRDIHSIGGPTKAFRWRNVWGVARFFATTLWDVYGRKP